LPSESEKGAVHDRSLLNLLKSPQIFFQHCFDDGGKFLRQIVVGCMTAACQQVDLLLGCGNSVVIIPSV
jgi:hypothetical protein